MNQLEKIKGIRYVPAQIKFDQYETLKSQAQEIAQFVASIEVTEDNVKEGKNILARSRKAIKALNDERIRINKEILKPYEVFRSQIKEIEAILDDANEVINEQIKSLEETARVKKKENVKELFDKHMFAFKYADLIKFDDFYQERHSNKSLSMSKIEDELNEFLEKVKKDLDYLKTKGRSEYIAEYLQSFDVTLALQAVEERQRLKAEIEETEIHDIVIGEETAIFEITGKANIKLVEMLLKENEIEYRKVK